MMAITERKVGDVTIVDLQGRVTLDEGADDFRELTRRLIRDGRIKLVINLEQVPYIDSTALGEIIRCYTTLTRLGGGLKLLAVQPHVHRLLIITRLLSIFDLFDEEAEAVKSFGTPRQSQT
jgi:anti-sigma B factor antagonist